MKKKIAKTKINAINKSYEKPEMKSKVSRKYLKIIYFLIQIREVIKLNWLILNQFNNNK